MIVNLQYNTDVLVSKSKLSSKVKEVPWLIIGYSRPEGVLRLTKMALELEIKKIYISIDGPSNENIKSLQDKLCFDILSLARFSQKTSIYINRFEKNLGVGIGVIAAIEWFFSQVKRGIVLEDDLIPSIDFFQFCCLGLEKIENDPSYWMVCGSQYFGDFTEGSAFGASIPQIWGWATSVEKWHEIRNAVFDLSENCLWAYFNISPLNFWLAGTRRVFQGKIDTWDIPIVFACIEFRKRVLLPPINLITNVGVDQHSSNTHRMIFPLGVPSLALPDNFNWSKLHRTDIGEIFEKKLSIEVYKIRFHHRFSFLFSVFFDWIRFPYTRRLEPFLKRWSEILVTTP